MYIGKKTDRLPLQTLIVSFCIFAVCIGTQQIQTVAWYTGIIEFSRDSLGVLMAVILFTNYKWSDFVRHKLPYIVWGILGIILGISMVPAVIAKRADFLLADTIVISLGIYFMGFCLIHTFISFFIEKYRPKFYAPLFGIWVVMLVLMIVSKSDYLWPECYFVLFLCYYMTKQTPAQRLNVITGTVNGIVMGFIVIQSHSLLFRPYDRVRYFGNFCNPNHNSMFLCICLAAILTKILFVEKSGQGIIRKIFYFMLAGSCYAFICMTMSRSGYLCTVVITAFFLLSYCKIKGKKIFIRMGGLLVLICIVFVPLTYLAVRYIPTIHPHVLFYFQEGYSEMSVHSWDERDSDKYITFQEMLQGILGRFGVVLQMPDDLQIQDVDMGMKESLMLASAAANFPPNTFLYVNNDVAGAEMTEEYRKIPILGPEEASNSFVVRYTIYKWYFSHLTLRGMPYEKQGFQLTEYHWIQDTHNIYLDYGINFGYPVMILFVVFIWWGIGRLTTQGMRQKDVGKMACLLIALVPPVFGLFEYAWGTGTISTVALYLVFKEMFIS